MDNNLKQVKVTKNAQKDYECSKCRTKIAKGTSFVWLNINSKDVVRCNECGFTDEERAYKRGRKTVEAPIVETPAVEAVQQAEQIVNTPVEQTA